MLSTRSFGRAFDTRRWRSSARRVLAAAGILVTLAVSIVPHVAAEDVEKPPATAVESNSAVERVPAKDAASGTKRALVFCGHPGDGEHAKRYAEVTTKILSGLVARLGFSEPAVIVLAGVAAEEGDDSLKADWPAATRGPATRESLAAALESLKAELRPEDTLWVISIGHAHMDGRLAWLNLPGPI